MKRIHKLMLFPALVAVALSLSSCNAGIDLANLDDPSVNFDESLVLPLGEANMSVLDLLNRIGLPEEADTVGKEIVFDWHFHDTTDLKNVNFADSVLPYRERISIEKYSPDKVGVFLPANKQVDVVVPHYFDFGVNHNTRKQRIDSVEIDSCKFTASISVSDDIKSQLQASDFIVQFLFEPENLKMHDKTIPAYYPTGFDKNENVSFGEFDLYLKRSTILPYKLKVILNPKKSIYLTTESFVNIYVKFTKISFSKAYGLFDISDYGVREIAFPFNIEEYLPESNLKFSDPKIRLKVHTNAGANLNMNIEYIYAYNHKNPDNKVWAWFDNHTTKSVSEYLEGPVKPGEWSQTDLAYDKNHGEIHHLFDLKPYPDKVNYKYDISTDITRENNFITNDSKIVADVNVEIPLKIRGGDPYAVADTIHNFDVKNIFDHVDSAMLVLKIRNGLPVKANYRMTFHKSDLPNDTIPAIGGVINKIVNESSSGNITSDYELKSPRVDAEGSFVEVVPQTIKIMLNKEQILALKQTKFIIFNILFDSEKTLVDGVETQNPVHITTDNTFGVKIGAFVKANFSTNLGSSK